MNMDDDRISKLMESVQAYADQKEAATHLNFSHPDINDTMESILSSERKQRKAVLDTATLLKEISEKLEAEHEARIESEKDAEQQKIVETRRFIVSTILGILSVIAATAAAVAAILALI